MTSCDRLPGIFAHGGVLSYSERQARGIAEPTKAHYWGSTGKKDELGDYVICSFMPPWWMCKARDEELAIVLLDAQSICARPDARFCPVNSAFNDYSAEAIRGRQGLPAFDECFENNVTYQAGAAEVFVPRIVPLAAFREIIFPDDEARAHWTVRINQTEYAIEPEPELPTEPIRTYVRSGLRFGFPGNYAPTRRVRDV